ncbi:mpv17 protein 2 [Biomphalaria glabrata]|nr:mpv17 protein 2 [Biomphalaria glabrata]
MKDHESTEEHIAATKLLHFVGLAGTWFDWFFDEHLLLANVLSAGLLLGLGDLTVQTIEQTMAGQQSRSRGFDMVRNRRTMIIGVILGLCDHLWYEGLDHYLRGNSLDIILKKVLLDQIIAGPFFCSAFIVGMCVLEGLSGSLVYKEWKETFPIIYKADWMFWPAAQMVNFYLVPPKYRVFYVNALTFVWNSFLSYKKHNIVLNGAHTSVNSILGFRTEIKNGFIFNTSKKPRCSPHASYFSERQRIFKNRSPQSVTRKVCKDSPTKASVKFATPKTMKKKKVSIRKKLGSNAKKQTLGPTLVQNNSNSDLRYSALEDQLMELHERINYLTDVTTDSLQSLDKAVVETRNDLNRVGLMMADALVALEETKLGLVNIAKQIISVVHLEGKKESETIATLVHNIIEKFETKLQSIQYSVDSGAPETVGKTQERDTSKQFTYL